jgi:tRNA1(Val) A37 N6-methylase TrmN6
MTIKPPTESVDKILGGALTVVQPLAGYRFSIDSILLGRFARPRARERVLELGTGCGVVAIMTAALYCPRDVVALELQPELAPLAARNAVLNDLRQVRVVCGDLRAHHIHGLTPASFDYIVANPPYRTLRNGRESPNASRRIARGAGGASLAEFIAAADRYATNRAKVAMVFTAARTAELIAELKLRALEPKRIRFVHPHAAMPATTILIEACKGGGIETEIESPLVLYEDPGVYTTEARELLSSGGIRLE